MKAPQINNTCQYAFKELVTVPSLDFIALNQFIAVRLRNAFVRFSLLFGVLFMASSCNDPGTIIICGGGQGFYCPAGMYCELGDKCGGIDRKGTCRRMPQDCPVEKEPVCACNNKTYDSACYANGAGQSIAYSGSCIGDQH